MSWPWFVGSSQPCASFPVMAPISILSDRMNSDRMNRQDTENAKKSKRLNRQDTENAKEEENGRNTTKKQF